MKRSWIILLVLTVLIGGGFLTYRKYFTVPEVQVLETARVERGDIRGVLVETGIIKSQVGAVVITFDRLKQCKNHKATQAAVLVFPTP